MSRAHSHYLGYPRRFTDFELVPCPELNLGTAPEGVTYALRVGEDPVRRGCVLFQSVAVGPVVKGFYRNQVHPFHVSANPVQPSDPAYDPTEWKHRPESTADLVTMGDRGAIKLAASVFDGACLWSIFADWIDDDAADRVHTVKAHAYPGHRLDPDPVTHFTMLLRRYRERRKLKPKKGA